MLLKSDELQRHRLHVVSLRLIWFAFLKLSARKSKKGADKIHLLVVLMPLVPQMNGYIMLPLVAPSDPLSRSDRKGRREEQQQ